MDLFKSNVEKMEKELIKQTEKDKKRARSIEITKHQKRYGTKKPTKRVNFQDILNNWRDDL